MLEEEKNENIEVTSEETVVETTEEAVEAAEVVEEATEAQEEAPKKKVLRASRAGRGERKSRKEKPEKPASDWTERVVQVRRVTKVVKGGKTRQESVFNGFKSTSNTDYLVIHDAARCLITKDLINKVIISAIQNDSCAVLGVPVKDTIKVIETVEDKNTVKYTADREFLWQIQTPQVLKKKEDVFLAESILKIKANAESLKKNE